MRTTNRAEHLGLAASTLSAAIGRRAALGDVIQRPDASQRRAVQRLLSAKGAAAMQASSVLESARVKLMLDLLKPAERKRALEGLSLLAKAARGQRK